MSVNESSVDSALVSRHRVARALQMQRWGELTCMLQVGRVLPFDFINYLTRTNEQSTNYTTLGSLVLLLMQSLWTVVDT